LVAEWCNRAREPRRAKSRLLQHGGAGPRTFAAWGGQVAGEYHRKVPDNQLACRLTVTLLDNHLACCRLEPSADLPAWAVRSTVFLSVTRTSSELSIVCDEAFVPEGVRSQRGLRALAVQGPLQFEMIGVLAALAVPLAEAGVSIFAISTYETDYLLVQDAQVEAAASALRRAGHDVRAPEGPAH
jgi:hypothetical protein